jgi:hypothetical protein
MVEDDGRDKDDEDEEDDRCANKKRRMGGGTVNRPSMFCELARMFCQNES